MWMLPQDMDVGMHVDGSDMDIVSFDDSEQFEEEDSVCSSWISDNDQVAYWSGWKESTHSTDVDEKEVFEDPQVSTLMELSAKCVAMNYAFEVVEQHNPPIPEALQLRIAFWSFPESKEEIRLYSCLACGSNDKFKQGDHLAMSGQVTEVLQIGFHLIGVVIQSVVHSTVKQKHNVSVTFDRGHITSCKCSCSEGTTWCEHAIALCIHRIIKKKDVSLRAPVSESMARLERDQLQKFAQHLISELPQQIRLAQKLLDELLSSKQSEINLQDGAPDPTAGASTIDDAKWVLDEASLRENIKKILGRFCGCLPMVVVDVNSTFLTTAPPVSLEWSNFIHSFQGHDPEAMWNLLSIVRHMFARCDHNASLLLTYITEECLLCYQMMFYWLSSYSNLRGNNKVKSKAENAHNTLHQNNDISRHASAHLMEEVVHLWELAVMMPYIPSSEKISLKSRFEAWDSQIIDAAKKGQGQGLAIHPPVRVTDDFIGFAPAIRASELDWDLYYEILGISEALLKELTFKGRGAKLDEFTNCTVDIMYQQISSIVPPDMDEYDLVTKLTHSLYCHGFVNKACKIASELARRIICGYPERLSHGELNFSSITEKADSLCNILLKCPGNERIVFEIAILGLTVPRFPAATNMEEVKLSYLEMALYQKLANIVITDEHLAFIRFQARKLLANPYLRGDAVLPLIIVTYIFEVLCKEHVQSSVLKLKTGGKRLRLTNPNSLTGDDNLLGYQCALVSLGLVTSTVDYKQPMLCESIRHHRRDLALALLSHCKADEQKIDEVIGVILDKERHGFMRSKQVNHNIVKWSGKEETKKANNKSDDVCHAQDAKLQTKYGFSFGNKKQSPVNTTRRPTQQPEGFKSPDRGVPDTSTRGHSNHHNPRRHDRAPKLSSDSDSGHGEGGDKRHIARNLNIPLTNSRKSQQQRRQFRQSNNRSRGDKSSRSERASTWVKHNKSTRTRKSSKTKTSHELTESDSGQEMHFSFEGDGSALPQSENWDDEIAPRILLKPTKEVSPDMQQKAGFVEDPSLSEFLAVYQGALNQNASKDDDDKSERWTISSPDCATVQVIDKAATGTFEIPSDVQPFNVQSTAENIDDNIEADFNIEIVPPSLAIAQQAENLHTNDATSDLGEDDDFNIEADMFHATLVEKVPSIDESPHLSETDELLEATIRQNVIDKVPLAGGIHSASVDIDDILHVGNVCEEEKPKMRMNVLPADELTTDFSSPDLDEAPVVPVISDIFFPQPQSPEDKIEINTVNEEGNDDVVNCAEDVLESNVCLSEEASNNVVTVSDIDYVTSKNNEGIPDNQACPATELLQNVLSLVVDMIDEDGATKNESSVTTEPVETKCEKLQLADLRVALESVCIEQAVPSAGEGPSVQVEPTEQVVKPKKKPKKNKKAKVRVSMNMQSIEAEAYSLFELAKSVLLEARNNNTFSTDVDEVITHNAANRRLQLAAFEIGLFALNIHNYSSPNWFSRTYSTYVSWIENQAVEVGSAAMRCLNERWEGVLTPSECVQIATRASRSGDSVMRRTAAELALSCLPYSQNLSTVDITQTITLCKDQDSGMLERACSAVENAGRHGGVQPELLFHIAREWHYLHEENQKLSAGSEDEQRRHSRNIHGSNVPNVNNNNNRIDIIDPVYMTAEQFVQEQMHQQAQEILGRQLPRNLGPDQFTWIYPQYYGPLHHCPLPQQAMHSRRIPNIDSYAVPISNFPDELNISEIPRYLQNSYRVGIRALEALTLRMPDETPDVKFALAPPMSDDIRWMCALSAQLGPPYLKIFCKIVYNAVTSPYLLHDLALEAARHFALYNPAQLASHLRSPSVSPIVQKALAMYTELVHYDLILLGTSGYADFVELLRKTRSAFCMAPGGMARFNEILELVRKSYPKKRELWQMIMNGLSKA